MRNNHWAFIFFVFLLTSFAAPPLRAQDADLVQSCADCHGEKGIAPSGLWPNLAGQKRGYLVSQIKAFREGRRKDPLMQPVVQSLSDKQIARLADYYTHLPVPESRLEQVNELGRHVSARCQSCHGRDGITVNTEWPNLAGQNAEYLKKQLFNYRSGERKHLLMQVIANELTEEEIEAVAEYLTRLVSRHGAN